MKMTEQAKRSFVEDDILARWKDEDNSRQTKPYTLAGEVVASKPFSRKRLKKTAGDKVADTLNFFDNPLIEEQFIKEHKYTTEEI